MKSNSAILNKSVIFIIKLLIVIAAFYFIYIQLTTNDKLTLGQFLALSKVKFTYLVFVFLLLFSIANRFLEILKWKNLVSIIKTISIGEATKQVLGALTAGIFTPNGLGEYAGKALYFDKKETKKVIFLNLICNGIQMVLTIIFGFLGLLIIGYEKEAAFLGILVLVLFTILFFIKKITIKGYSLEKLLIKIGEIPKEIHARNNIFAILRYLVFSHQYYFLFRVFNVDLPYITLMATIAVVYFLASSLPSFQFLDFAVKGSVALFFFEKIGVAAISIIFISTLMWFLNVVLPVIIGSYFVLIYKPYQPSKKITNNL
jgi:hypothetical protein